MRFEFATATRIIFGPGTINEAAVEAASFGTRALIVTGRSVNRAYRLLDLLSGSGLKTFTFAVAGEPTVDTIIEGIAFARKSGCAMVIGFGGGSAIDAAKAIAALLANPGDLVDYLELIGNGKRLVRPAVPCIAILTTAGTGAEVTKNAVITSLQHHVKVSLRSPFMLPRLALVDPDLTRSMPPGVTAGTGLDALTQCIESYVSGKSNPMTDALCREGIERAARSLRTACRDGDDAASRENMSLASLLSGLALANSGLGAVHGFAASIGGMCASAAPHGTVCALLLPHVMEANVRALQSRLPASPALSRYASVARILTGNESASATDGVAWIKSLCAGLPVPSPAIIGLDRDLFSPVAAAARNAGSMKGNPVELTEDELTGILEKAFPPVK